MSDDAQRWKSKYLENLEQQEKLERRWDARLDLLRRGLVRSSLAAEGTDKAVDQCMQDMREILRRDDMDAGLSALIPRLEKAVLDSEQRRETRVAQVSAGLSALAAQLQALELPGEVRKPLKRFVKELEARAGQARELPVLLVELGNLQRQALALRDASQAQRPGLLQRLFGREDGADMAAAAAVPVIQPVTAEPDMSETAVEPLSVAPAPEAPAAPAVPVAVPLAAAAAPALAAAAPSSSGITLLDSLPLPAALLGAQSPVRLESQTTALSDADPDFALPPAPEPGYSAIAEHVEATLLGLLEALSLPERHQPQAELLRERIQAGLNLYELVPVLEDFAVLMLAVADNGQREFEGYLKQLNERLSTFQGSLQEAHDGYAESVSAARELDSELRQQVDGLHSSVQEATDLNSLKSVVENRLDGLLSTMTQFQRQRDAREQAVVGRLQTLVERVASMEHEAKGFRDHLEEQRLKALIDPLTGLPNRAAWIERMELEVARWQRYGGDLLLAVVDIDHFKRINDNYGHLAGDKVLKIIAGELANRLRKTDFIARFGGEEFVLLVPATTLAGGQQLLETLRAGVELCPFHFKGEPVTITLSAGISAFMEGDQGDQVFERADQALYRAKHGGRNRVELG